MLLQKKCFYSMFTKKKFEFYSAVRTDLKAEVITSITKCIEYLALRSTLFYYHAIAVIHLAPRLHPDVYRSSKCAGPSSWFLHCNISLTIKGPVGRFGAQTNRIDLEPAPSAPCRNEVRDISKHVLQILPYASKKNSPSICLPDRYKTR